MAQFYEIVGAPGCSYDSMIVVTPQEFIAEVLPHIKAGRSVYYIDLKEITLAKALQIYISTPPEIDCIPKEEDLIDWSGFESDLKLFYNNGRWFAPVTGTMKELNYDK